MSSTSAATGPGAVFLSYNRADESAVHRICGRLHGLGVETFFDKKDLMAGLPWPEALDAALRGARAVLVFVGGSGFGDWQKREIYYALDLQTAFQRENRTFPVVPVLLEGAETGPSFLFLNTWVDLRGAGDESDAYRLLLDAVGGRVQPDAGGASRVCPYLGLRAFREEDAPLFFGRDEFTERLLAKTLQLPLVAVVGPSGSGKSSVVRAGLIPRLRRRRPPELAWDIVVHIPTADPFRSLADALLPLLEPGLSEAERLHQSSVLSDALRTDEANLASAVLRVLERSRGTDRLLLVVDQFEELFTLTPPEARASFLKSLVAAARSQSVTVVLTLRADFYGHAIGADRELSEAIEAGVVNLGPPRSDELRQIIETPAGMVGVKLAVGLGERLLSDLEAQPGALPLLEYALTTLWANRSGDTLTHAAYESMGRLEGAIASRAEQVFQHLNASEQRAARSLMLRLVRPAKAGDEAADTRRRASREEVGETAWTVAQGFAAAENRLLVLSGDPNSVSATVELAHEAILRHWGTLRTWIDEDREFLAWRQSLGHFIEAWEREGRRGTELLIRGEVLAVAKRWTRQRAADLSATEKRFIRSSSRRRARVRIALFLAAGTATFTLLSVAAGLWYARTDHFQMERILTLAAYDVSRVQSSDLAAEGIDRYLAALGMLGRAYELEHVGRAYPPRNSAEYLEDVFQRLVARWEPDVAFDRPPRNLLLGLIAAGHDAQAGAIARSAREEHRACAEAVIASGLAALGRSSEARPHLDRALASVDRGSRWSQLCVAEAAARCADRKAVADLLASAVVTRADFDDTKAYPALASALAERDWAEELQRYPLLIGEGYQDEHATRSLGMVLNALLMRDRVAEALDAFRRFERQPWAHRMVVSAFIQRGDLGRAAQVLHRSADDYERRSLANLLLAASAARNQPEIAASVSKMADTDFALAFLPRIAADSSRERTSVSVHANRAHLLSQVAAGLAGEDLWRLARVLLNDPDIPIPERDAILEAVAGNEAREGRLDRAYEAAKQIGEEWTRKRALAKIVYAHFLRRETTQGVQTIGSSGLEWFLVWDAARDALRAGLTTWTTAYAAPGDPERSARRLRAARDLSTVLRALRQHGLATRADELSEHLLQNAFGARDSRDGSYLLSTFAAALAMTGDSRTARLRAEEASEPADRIFAYAQILTAMAEGHDPRLAEHLQRGVGAMLDFPSGPWQRGYGRRADAGASSF